MTAPTRPSARALPRQAPSAPRRASERPAAFPVVTVDENPAQARTGRAWDLLVDLVLGIGWALLIATAGLIVVVLGGLWLAHQAGAW